MKGITSGEMKPEVSAAASFISNLMGIKSSLSEHQLHLFTQTLSDLLTEHYQHHWFPHAPFRGSGYRCLRINHKMDPLIGKAGIAIGLRQEQLFSLLPKELTMWVDPYEVSYRIGEDGSTCVLHKFQQQRPKSVTSADVSSSWRKKLKTRRYNRQGLNRV